MKKSISLFFLTASILYHARAQNTFPSSGNVGIGTTTPQTTLDVNGGIFSNAESHYSLGSYTDPAPGFAFAVKIGSGGFAVNGNSLFLNAKVGIGLTSPQYNLDLNGNAGFRSDIFLYGDAGSGQSNSDSPNLIFEGTNYAGASSISAPREETYGRRGIAFSTHSDPSDIRNLVERMRINYIGNVLIGKTTQQNTNYKLDVAGSVRANEITVNTTGADFVFKKGYVLPNLSKIKDYIEKKHHLPEIPSADDMQKDGVGLGEINMLLLKKVEELTLYIVGINHQNELQSAAIKRQDLKIKVLNKKLTALFNNHQTGMTL